ncbi:MAG: sigma factor, partial [Eubacteriales bacterium]|nr:sigma factor [Eubacteriales bacterium]
MKYSEKMIQDAIRGKEEAIELLYNRTYSNVHFIIANFVKDTDDALDLIMNTYVSGFQNLHMLTDASEFGEWIETIAQNQVLHYLKKKNNVKYENITIEDISRVCELGLSNNTRSKIKPNQRLLELIENECVFYDDADDYDMGNVQEIIEHEKKRREEKRIRKEHIREQEQKFAEEHPDEYEEDRTDTILKVIIAVAAVAAVALLVGVVGIFILKGHNSSDNSNNVTETTQNQEDKQNKIVDNDGQEVIPTPTRIPLGKSTGDSEEQNVTATPV